MNTPPELQLCLLRHAHAGNSMKWAGADENRPLTEKGRRQSERLGRLLAGSGFRLDAILTSPKIRAAETAGLVAAPLGLRPEAVQALAGPFDLDALEELLHDAGDPSRPLLVGHDPDFSALAAELVGLAELPMRKAALIRIDVARPLRPGQGVVRWLVPPDLLGSDG